MQTDKLIVKGTSYPKSQNYLFEIDGHEYLFEKEQVREMYQLFLNGFNALNNSKLDIPDYTKLV